MEKIKVPDDIPHSLTELCGKENRSMVRCDRKINHEGMHSWEMMQKIRDLQSQLKMNHD